MILLLCGMLLCTACGDEKYSPEPPVLPAGSTAGNSNVDKTDRDAVLRDRTADLLQLLKDKNYSAFAEYIHPVEGVRFSPYGHVDTLKDVHLSKADFILLYGDGAAKKTEWGYFDGSGEPIRMTFQAYFDRFVYDVDFLNAPQKSVNKTLGRGNMINNMDSVYTGTDYTENHFPGFDEKYRGMDWRSLRLVYKMRDGEPFLVGVVHDEWTN